MLFEPLCGKAFFLPTKMLFFLRTKSRSTRRRTKKKNLFVNLCVLDEIQCGFGRNGSLWAFEQFDVVPDILLLGKALGGGMPLGAFVADKNKMDSFTNNPVLGHINTFGGHPVCCAAGNAAMQFLLEENIIEEVFRKEKLFVENCIHPKIKDLRSRGLMIAIEFESFEQNKKVIDGLLKEGVFFRIGFYSLLNV